MARKKKADSKMTAGEKRAEARRLNRESRQRISEMTNQQLKNFFGGFETDDIERIEKALTKVREDVRKDEVKRIEKQIEELEKKRQELAAG